MTTRPRVILASASPARLRRLRAAGLHPDVVISGVNEDIDVVGSPGDHALLLARLKARAVAQQVVGAALVIGCDSVLDLDGDVHGKPASPAEVVARWERQRGRSGVLRTGHCVIDLPSGRAAEAVASTTVHFAHIDDEEIAAYAATDEPLHVAGAFTIDGLAGAFVRSLDGDPHNVVGISLPLLRELLGQLGVRWTDLW